MAARRNIVQFSLTDGDFAQLVEQSTMWDAKPSKLARDIVRKYLKKALHKSGDTGDPKSDAAGGIPDVRRAARQAGPRAKP